MKNKLLLIFLFVMFLVSFVYRSKNLHTPLWVDEFSTASQAQFFDRSRSHTSFQMEKNNFTTHALSFVSLRLHGQSEAALRLPSVLIGSLIPLAVFFAGTVFFNFRVGILASVFSSFSYFQITWSRQARGYVLQQLLILLTIIFYTRLLKKFSWKECLIAGVCIVLGILTHSTFILILLALGLHFAIFHFDKLLVMMKKPVTVISLIGFAVIFILTGQFATGREILTHFTAAQTFNLPYYHSFLWREQTVVALLAFLGMLFSAVGVQHMKKINIPSIKTALDSSFTLLLPILMYLFFLSFIFPPYVSRYIAPIFPLLLIFASLAIDTFASAIYEKKPLIAGVLIAVFIIANGDKFVLKPKAFYSVNHDMREVALVDYDQVYQIIRTKGQLDQGKTAVIDTWPDRTKWYLGEPKEYMYVFRWTQEEGLVNGLPKTTPFEVNEDGDKYLPKTGSPSFKLISELSDLQKAMKTYPRGFIWIDDTSLPAEVINFVTKNFKKELYLDHYPLDDNPYSIWPGTLYSWGFEK